MLYETYYIITCYIVLYHIILYGMIAAARYVDYARMNQHLGSPKAAERRGLRLQADSILHYIVL